MAELAAETARTFQYTLKELVTFRMVRLNAKLTTQAARLLKNHSGLTPAQWRVMFMIHDNGPMTPARVGRLIGMDKGQLSRTIKSMVDTGILASTASEADQRSFELHLTASGQKLFHRAMPVMQKRQARLMGCLTDEERAVLYRAFDKLEAVTEEPGDFA